MQECVFCRIIKKEIPASIVVEDDTLIAIEDINPQSPIHILVMPKKHYPTLLDCKKEDVELLGRMLLMANKIAINKGFHERGYRLALNVREGGGQTLFHMHMHVLAGRPLSGRLG